MQAIIEWFLSFILFAVSVIQATPSVEAASGPSQLTTEQLTQVLIETEWPPDWIPGGLAIAWCESKFSSYAQGDSGSSLGIFQLWDGWFREGEDPFNPHTNATVALRVRQTRGRFGGSGGWACADLLGIP